MRRLTLPVRSRLKAAVTRVARRETDTLRREVKAAGDATSHTVDDVRREVSSIRMDLDTSNRQHIAASDRLDNVKNAVDIARSALDDLAKFHDEDATTMTVIENRTRELSALVESLRCSVELILGPTGRHMSRLITHDELDELIDDFDFVQDRASVSVSLHVAYRTLVDLELRCLGRFDGSTANILAKLTGIMVLPPPSGEILQIGTLFGVGAAGFARQVARTGAEAHLTIVDPFAGGPIPPDRGADRDVSLSPVTPSVVTTNLALAGLDERHYRLIEGRSDDSDVQRAASDRRYGLIVIDGDHSSEAALNDLIWAESVAEPGALVVLDDFGDPTWPGIADAFQAYAGRPSSTLRMVGTASTSAFLRAEGSA